MIRKFGGERLAEVYDKAAQGAVGIFVSPCGRGADRKANGAGAERAGNQHQRGLPQSCRAGKGGQGAPQQ